MSNTYIRRTACKNIDHAVELIIEAYNIGYTYFYGCLEEKDFMIRMNKDHPMNIRNNNYSEHVLSLVTGKINTRSYTNVLGYVIREKGFPYMDKEDLENEIYDFLNWILE